MDNGMAMRQRWLGPRGRMMVAFLGILAGLNSLYYAEKKLELGIVDWPYTKFVAWASAVVGDLILPYPLAHVGNAIIADQRTSVLIASGCNGLEAIFLMFAAILAYPATWSRRWRALVLYGALLFGLNLLRVVFLTHMAHMHQEYLDLAHYQIAQGILVVFVLFFWFHYVRGT
jgi:exosortase/archaeosortase family protein